MTITKYECDDCMKDFLKQLPKCEHHVHLEGTLEPNLLFKLAKRNHITLPSNFPKTEEECRERYNNFADLQDFLDHYYIGMSVLIKEQDFYDLAMSYFKKAHDDGCLHSEVFFDPQGHLERSIELKTVVSGFHKACIDANKKFGTTNKLIMCLLRHLPSSDGLKVIQDSKKYYQNNIIHGLGLDSSEKPFPPRLFENCYNLIHKEFPNVGLTAHAGEEGNYKYVEDSLNLLKVTRIDHGVNSKQSKKLMERLAKDQTLLTICPLSNVKLQVVKDVSELPISLFFNKNIPFSINSDDPAYFGGYILENYIAVHESFGFGVKEWKQISLNGINGSWCSEDRKKELRNKVDEVCEKFGKLISI
ncbi:AAH1 [Candida pseudojiufengensis]|uniref:AAH1 n=1 Tax=Candida pseudojiufengensis TaxID=497109 RepID=UPI0022241568|nr:AAH1 [Candida pseudojiufengensis]KAI5965283.1 AAH1 [Candida pseudojiufengensis]